MEWETEVQFTKKLAAKAVENAKLGRHGNGIPWIVTESVGVLCLPGNRPDVLSRATFDA